MINDKNIQFYENMFSKSIIFDIFENDEKLNLRNTIFLVLYEQVLSKLLFILHYLFCTWIVNPQM